MRSALAEVAEGIEAMAGRPHEWSASSLTKTKHYNPADAAAPGATAEGEDADDEPTAKTDEPSRPVALYSAPRSPAASTPTVRRRRSRLLPLFLVLAVAIGAGLWLGLLAGGRECRTRVTIATPGARAWLDGLPFASEIDLPGSCGDRHRLHVEAPGFASRDLVVEASESPGTRVELAPATR